MTVSTFRRLVSGAQDCESYAQFEAESGGSLPYDCTGEKSGVNRAEIALHFAWAVSRMESGRLAWLRDKAQMTRDDFARWCGVTRDTERAWERRGDAPDMLTDRILTDALNDVLTDDEQSELGLPLVVE